MARLDVSVVIPCRNGAAVIGQQLRALRRQSTRIDWEVLVADNGSEDATAEIVSQFGAADPRIRLIDASRAPGINVARNEGVIAARGDLVLFCDADDEVGEGWIEAFVAAHRQSGDLFGGYQLEIFRGEVVATTGLRDSLGFLPWALGANCGVHRSTFDAIGLFAEEYRGGGDETDFFWRAQLAGFSLREVPDAIIRYHQRDSLIEIYRQHVTYGRSNVRLYERFRDFGMPDPCVDFGATSLMRASARVLLSRGVHNRVRYLRRLGLQVGALAARRERR